MTTDWDSIHRTFIETFRTGWDRPHPHAWDEFTDDRTVFVQPMLRNGTGPETWWEESARTLALMPDLRADVLSWAGAGELLYIHIRFSATLGGKPLTWDAVDLVRLSDTGVLLRRESFFDSVPVAATLVGRPRSWWAWWRSGVGPLTGRRRFMRPPALPESQIITTTGGT
jgi:SnoaL-like domain